jgi:hypothetical protein
LVSSEISAAKPVSIGFRVHEPFDTDEEEDQGEIDSESTLDSVIVNDTHDVLGVVVFEMMVAEEEVE